MSDYHRMSIAQKQAHARGAAREQAVVCPRCETQTTPADLLAHLSERCPGRRDPHPASAWVTWRQALAMGVLRGTLSKWVDRGLVRIKGDAQDRRYLMRDLVSRLAARRSVVVGGFAAETEQKKISGQRARTCDPGDGMAKDAYAQVQAELDAALAAKDPESMEGACRRAQLALAKVAAGESFDMRRHRAIQTSLRELAKGNARAGAVR